MPNSRYKPDDNEASSTTPLLKQRQDNGESTATDGRASADHVEDEWDDKRNHDNPRNWSPWFKWAAVILVSFIEFLTTMPNFMYAPNITEAEADLGTSDNTLATFSLTIYVLGFGLGPLLFAPLSELYGRSVVYRSCLAAFLVMTIGCGLSQNIEMLVAFRFFAGSFGAAPVAIGGAVVGDLFPVKERGTAMSIYQAGKIISAVVGPPLGGLIGSYLIWRWVFWIVCILAGFAFVMTLFILKETHAPTLQRSKYGPDKVQTDDEKHGLAVALRQALARPVKLLVKSPVVLAGCVLIFIVIGILNVFLTELSRMMQEIYAVSSGQSGYMYFGIALGFVAASVLFGLTNDRIMHALAKRHDGEVRPEYRLPSTIAAMPIVVIGTLWYGWSLQFRTHWIIPIVGSAVAGLGITTVQLSITTYMVDAFDEFSAPALAAVTMARSIGGAVVPLLGPLLYEHFDQGWGNSIIALAALACSLIPVLMYIYGSRWRAMFSIMLYNSYTLVSLAVVCQVSPLSRMVYSRIELLSNGSD